MALTRRRALAASGLLLAGLSGCSSVDESATASPTATERGYAETVEEPVSRTVRGPSSEFVVRSTLANPISGWADSHWLIRDRDDREALYFADDAEGVDAARSLIEATDFSSALVLVNQHPVSACRTWVLERLHWGAGDADAPPGSAAVELDYERERRSGDCEEDPPGDVAATFVRVPARFERTTSFGVRVS